MGSGLEGTNREWLRKQNDYDLLCRIQDLIKYDPPIECILYLLTGDDGYRMQGWPKCPMRNFKTEEEFENFTCKDCIANWLNEKHS